MFLRFPFLLPFLTFLLVGVGGVTANDWSVRLRLAETTTEDWADAMRALGDESERALVRDAVFESEEFPRVELVALLENEALAVRLGAFGLLEEARGGDEGYLPFSPPGNGENEEALAKWRIWSESDTPIQEGQTAAGQEMQQRYLRELMSDDRSRAQRAKRGLKREGLEAVALIENFLQSNQGLPIGEKARLREAQYDIVLAENLDERSGQVARDLVFGNRDQKLTALGTVREVGPLAIPILRQFIDSEDALIREAALDSLLAAGRTKVFPLVTEVMAEEKDINVLHGVIRRLKDIPGNETAKLLMPLMSHPDEDILTSVMSALANLVGGNDRYGSFGRQAKANPLKEQFEAQVLPLLDDPRWRVRAAALECVGSLKAEKARERVGELLGDEDEFVSFRAIEAAVRLGGSDLLGKLKERFLASDDLIVPVLAGYSSLEKAPDKEMIAHLKTREPDLMISGLAALEDDASAIIQVVASFAEDENLDVACAALRRLAKDDDSATTNPVASILVRALQSGEEAKVAAVLDSLRLPNVRPRNGLSQASRQFAPAEPTKLDGLYAALLRKPAPAVEGEEEDGTPLIRDVENPVPSLMTLLAKIGRENTPGGFDAALQLARYGDSRGCELLLEKLPGMSSAQRGQIAEGMYYVSTPSMIPVLEVLLADEVEAIRMEAVELSFREEKALALVELPFNELDRENTPLKAEELANYYFSDLADTSGGKRLLGGWCRGVLANEGASTARKVIACYGLKGAWRSSDRELVAGLVKSENPWVRRAAWHLLGQADVGWFGSHLTELLEDGNPQVRAVLSEVSTRNRSAWEYVFTDTVRKKIYEYNSQRSKRSLSRAMEEGLRKVAAEDGDDELRFEAYFALLSHQREIDLDEFTALIAVQPKEVEVPKRLADYFSENRRRVGVGVKSLLAYADLEEISASEMDELESRFGGSDNGHFLSFASLNKAVEVTGAQVAPEDEGEALVAERERLSLVYFHKPGCKDCARVEDLLASMEKDFPLLEIEKYSIMEAEATVLNQALCLRFGVPAKKQTLTPAVFAQGGALIKEGISPSQLGGLLEETMELPEDDAWMEVGVEDLAMAEEKIEERFEALTLPVIIGAGLLDGINPCAFATIIFFLSYLQVAKRSSREILMIGVAFILAVFLTYFAVGIALHGLIEQVARFKGAQLVMTWVFAAFALVVAILSFRDGLKARKKGGIKEMSLQLPDFLKNRIRKVIRKGAKARNFVVAAFASGVVISLLELACTGQVYAPIIFKIQQGDFDAVGYLAIYNLAFITPLVIIFGMAFGGMRSETLIEFQSKHTAAVKFGLAALFFTLFLILVFQDKIL